VELFAAKIKNYETAVSYLDIIPDDSTKYARTQIPVTLNTRYKVTANLNSKSSHQPLIKFNGDDVRTSDKIYTSGLLPILSTHTFGVEDQLSSPAGDAQFKFKRWILGGKDYKTNTLSAALGAAVTDVTLEMDTYFKMTVDASNADWGRVTVEPTLPASQPLADGFFPAGKAVRITATPKPGYYFSGYTGDFSGTNAIATVTVDAAKTIKANFLPWPTLTLTSNLTSPDHLDRAVTANEERVVDDRPRSYEPGTKVLLQVVDFTTLGGTERWVFRRWSDGNNLRNRSLTIGRNDLKLGIQFDRYIAVTTLARPPAGGTVDMVGEPLPIEAAGGGRFYLAGPSRILGVPSATFYLQKFTGATVSATGAFTLTEPVTITGNFARQPILTITSTVEEATVSINKQANQPTPANTRVTPGVAVDLSVPEVLTPARPNESLRFVSWSDGNKAATRRFTASETANADGTSSAKDTTLTTTYHPYYGINLIRDTGCETSGVTISPAAVGGRYPAGPVTLVATARAGCYFAGYEGDVSDTKATATVQLSKPLAVKAKFVANPSLMITSTLPAGLRVVSIDGNPTTLPATVTVTPGTRSALAAAAMLEGPDRRFVFLKWSDGVASRTRTYVQTTANATLEPIYQTQYSVTTRNELPDTGLPVLVGSSATGTNWVPAGSTVLLQARPLSGFRFAGFTGSVTTSENPHRLTATGPAEIVAKLGPIGGTQITIPSVVLAPDLKSVTVSLKNWGPSGVIGLQIDSASITPVSPKAAQTEIPIQMPPVVLGNWAAAVQGAQTLPLQWPAGVDLLRLSLRLSGNAGSYRATATVGLMRPGFTSMAVPSAPVTAAQQ
jgi:hypothetical protein